MYPTVTLICARCGREEDFTSALPGRYDDHGLPPWLIQLVDRPEHCGLCATSVQPAIAA